MEITESTARTATTRSERATGAKPPRRLGVAVALGVAFWVAPLVAGGTVLLPARLGELDPANKVALLTVVATVSAVLSLVMNLVFGALSDRTRGRLGRRTPWMLIGSAGCAVGLVIAGAATSLPVLIAGWLVFQLFINAIIAAMIAVIPDRVPVASQGSYSAVYGVSLMVGGGLGGVVGGALVLQPSLGFFIFAGVVLLSGVFVAVIAPDRTNPDAEGIVRPSAKEAFRFPTKGARDFYLAGAAKLLFVVAAYGVQTFQLYILTDFIGVTAAEAGGVISITSLILLAAGLLFGSVAGPISDRMGRRKPLVIGAALVIAGGLMIIVIFQSVPAMIAYAVIGGAGLAVFQSVDQALNYAVLPSMETAAKDLGILNVANTGGQIVAPAVAGAILAVGLGYAGLLVALAGSLVLSALVLIPIKKTR